jgi:hypothetical protein
VDDGRSRTDEMVHFFIHHTYFISSSTAAAAVAANKNSGALLPHRLRAATSFYTHTHTYTYIHNEKRDERERHKVNQPLVDSTDIICTYLPTYLRPPSKTNGRNESRERTPQSPTSTYAPLCAEKQNQKEQSFRLLTIISLSLSLSS